MSGSSSSSSSSSSSNTIVVYPGDTSGTTSYSTSSSSTSSTTTPTTPTTNSSSTNASGGGGGGGGVSVGAEGSGSDIEVKSTAIIANLVAAITSTFSAIVAAWQNFASSITPVITSGNDSIHMANSAHYTDEAIDLRAKNLTDAQAVAIVNELQNALGSDYDVIYENYGDDRDHIHIEYDPGP